MVECHLAKVDVEGSNPFSRSPKAQLALGFFRFWGSRFRRLVLQATSVVMTPAGSHRRSNRDQPRRHRQPRIPRTPSRATGSSDDSIIGVDETDRRRIGRRGDPASPAPAFPGDAAAS